MRLIHNFQPAGNFYTAKWLLSMVMLMVVWQPSVLQASGVEANEQKLLASFAALQNLQLDQSIQQLSELNQLAPNYKLAKMLKADLLAIRAGQNLADQGFRSHYPKTIAALKSEAKVRWQFSQSSVWLTPPLEEFLLKSAGQPYALLIDLAQRRLHLYQNIASAQVDGEKVDEQVDIEKDKWLKVEDFYISMGASGTGKLREGDRRTPLGIYLIADNISQHRLPDFYGSGALPINYPNLWDRTQNRTGSGIWLHGVPSDTYARNPNASRGCVVLTNDAMQKIIVDYQLPLSTPVILWDRQKSAPSLQSNPNIVAQLQNQLLEKFPSIDWQQVSIYRYPNETNLFLVTYPSQQSGLLQHQYWQLTPHAQSGRQWTLKAQADEPIEIKYQF